MLKKITLTILLCAGFATLTVSAQKAAIKTDLLYGATATPNLSFELGAGQRTTFDLRAGYNPFTFNNGKRFKHYLIQPGFRWWFCDRFAGWFAGVHLHGGEFSTKKIKPPFELLPTLNRYRYEGYFYGGGASIGYQWMLGKRWGVETELGVGYARFEYDKYGCQACASKIKSDSYNYFGPTRATISLAFYLW